MEPRRSPYEEIGMASASPEFLRYASQPGVTRPQMYEYLKATRPDAVAAAENELKRSLQEDDDAGFMSSIGNFVSTSAKMGGLAAVTMGQIVTGLGAAVEQGIFGPPEKGDSYRPMQNKLVLLRMAQQYLSADEEIARGNAGIEARKQRRKQARADAGYEPDYMPMVDPITGVTIAPEAAKFVADVATDIADYVSAATETIIDDPAGGSAAVGALAAQTLPTVAASMAAYATAGPLGGFAAGSLMEIGGQFSDALIDQETGGIRELTGRDAALAISTGTAAGMVEMIGARNAVKLLGSFADRAALSSGMKKAFKRELINDVMEISKTSSVEGLTESIQTVITNIGAKYGWDPDRVYTEGVGESFVAGVIASGVTVAGGKVVTAVGKPIAPSTSDIREGGELPVPAADPAMVQQLQEAAAELDNNQLIEVVESAEEGDIRGEIAAQELVNREGVVNADPEGAAADLARPEIVRTPVFSAPEKPAMPPAGQEVSDALAKDLEKYVREGGDITAEEASRHPRVQKAYLAGSPKEVQNIEDHSNLVSKLEQLAALGEAGTEWYENSGKELLRLARTPERARLLAQLIAITSPQNPVPQNWDDAIKIYNQWVSANLRGEEVEITGGKTGDINKKAEALLYRGEDWSGLKTNSFYNNIVGILDGKMDDDVTVDIWVLRAFGFPVDKQAPTEAQYRYSRRTINDIAKKNGLLGRQVQAQIWEATKYLKDSHGITNPLSVDLSQYDPNEVKSVDYSTVADLRTGQVSAEAVPGRGTQYMDGLHDAPDAVKQEYTKMILSSMEDSDGNNILMDAFGVLAAKDVPIGVGFYEGDTNPVVQIQTQFVKGKGRSEEANVKMKPSSNVVFGDSKDLVVGKFGSVKAAKEALAVYIQAQEGDAQAQETVRRMRLSKAVVEVFDAQIEKQKTYASDPSLLSNVKAFAAAWGKLTQQHSVGYHRAVPTARQEDANGVQIVLSDGKQATAEQLAAIEDRINSEFPESIKFMATSPGEVLVVLLSATNQDGTPVTNQQWQQAVSKIAGESISPDVKVGFYGVESGLVENDWEVNKNGEGYDSWIALEGRPDIQKRLFGTAARKIAQGQKRFASRTGLGDPARYDALIDQATEVERGDQLSLMDAADAPILSDVRNGERYSDVLAWMSQQGPGSEARAEYDSVHREGKVTASQKQMAVLRYGDMARAMPEGPQYDEAFRRMSSVSDQELVAIGNDKEASPIIIAAAFAHAVSRGLDAQVQRPPIYMPTRQFAQEADMSRLTDADLVDMADRMGVPDAASQNPIILRGRMSDGLYSGSVVDTVPAGATMDQALDHISVHSQNAYEVLDAMVVARDKGTQSEVYQKLYDRYVELTGKAPSSMEQRQWDRVRNSRLYQDAQLSEDLPAIASVFLSKTGVDMSKATYLQLDAMADDVMLMGLGQETSFPDAVSYLSEQDITRSDRIRLSNEIRKQAEQLFERQTGQGALASQQAPSVFGDSVPAPPGGARAAAETKIVAAIGSETATRRENGAAYFSLRSMFAEAKQLAARLANSSTCK